MTHHTGRKRREHQRRHRTTADGWKGRYHHFDAHPDGLGQTLWRLYHAHFAGNVDAMVQTLVDEHPAGWSNINDADFTLSPGFRSTRVEGSQPPSCYCHGERHDAAQLFTEHGECSEETCAPEMLLWVYVLSHEGMAILRGEHGHHVPVGFVRWGGPQPDWRQLERARTTT